jgi:hypothetical protein
LTCIAYRKGNAICYELNYVEKRKQELIQQGYQESDIFLVSFDFESFYPSVPHEKAVEAFSRAESKLEAVADQVVSLKKILEFHLKNAFFRFGKKFFRQKKGLPIGSSIGGPMACLTLAQAEDELLRRLEQTNPTRAAIFRFYRRFQDDSILVFACRSLEEAKRIALSFLQDLNSMVPEFRFTTDGATQDLVFLDIHIQVREKLTTKNYHKPTDKRTLLNASSDHPIHVKRAIAYGVALRMRRLCSEEEDFKQALVEQGWALLARGHLPKWIRTGFARAAVKSRQECLLPKEKSASEIQKVRAW